MDLIERYLYGVAILAQVFQDGHWLEVSSPITPAEVMPRIQANFDLGMRVGIGVTILGMPLRVGLELWRGYRQRQGALTGAVRA